MFIQMRFRDSASLQYRHNGFSSNPINYRLSINYSETPIGFCINPNRSGHINVLDNSCCNAMPRAQRVRHQTKSTSTNQHLDDGRGEKSVGRMTESNLTSC